MASKPVLILTALCLTACSNAFDRLSNIGEAPELSDINNPTSDKAYKPVTMPMPQAWEEKRQPNSLWRTGSRSFFKDQRAGQVGDLVTVIIQMSDKASLKNSTTQTRASSETDGINSLGGFENKLKKVLPAGVNPSTLVGINSANNNQGTGQIDRNETINLKVSAVVTQILPNGNLVIMGRQETRVNFEVRELQVAGVIRPVDINSDNTITYDKIAEARLSYGGRGHITDAQQPRYGEQVLDVLLPF